MKRSALLLAVVVSVLALAGWVMAQEPAPDAVPATTADTAPVPDVQEEVIVGEPVIGAPAPEFALPDLEGKVFELGSFRGSYVVLEWTNYDCPFVVKHYSTNNMQDLQKKYMEKGVVWLVINSSAPGKQGHFSPEEWKKLAAERNSTPTAILLDTDGKVGKTYLAKTTPHMFILDPQGTLLYNGAIDDNSSRNPEDVKTAKNYVQTALDQAMAGTPVETPLTDSYGCSVKY
jgi:peroxiredoxin